MSARVVVEDPNTREFFNVSVPAARLLLDDGAVKVWLGSTLDELDDATILMLADGRGIRDLFVLVGASALSPIRRVGVSA